MGGRPSRRAYLLAITYIILLLLFGFLRFF